MEIILLVMEVHMPGHLVCQKLQAQNELLWHIMDSKAVIWSSHESVCKATRAVLKDELTWA
jgi:hypothetical protein